MKEGGAGQRHPGYDTAMKHEILEEVWRVRDQISAESGHDVKKLGSMLRREESKYADRLARLPIRRRSALGRNKPLLAIGANHTLTSRQPSLSSPCVRSRHVMVGRPAAPSLDPSRFLVSAFSI